MTRFVRAWQLKCACVYVMSEPQVPYKRRLAWIRLLAVFLGPWAKYSVAFGTLDPADSSVTHASDSAAHARSSARPLSFKTRLSISRAPNPFSDQARTNPASHSRPTPFNSYSAATPLQTPIDVFGRFFVSVCLFLFAYVPLNNVAVMYKNLSMSLE